MNKQLARIKVKTLDLNFPKWHNSGIALRKAYIAKIGITDTDDVDSLIHMPFHLLP